MKIIGLTGGIGSGKSYVCQLFNQKGVPVYNSDLRGRDINNNHPVVKEAYINRYGPGIYVNGVLDRNRVSQIVFSNRNELDWINGLIHPIVKADFEEWLTLQNSTMVIKEAAILIESGAYKQCHQIIIVVAPVDVRIKRVMQRDGLTKEQVEQRIANQMTDKEKKKFADFVIVNDGIQLVHKQVDEIFNKLNILE